MRLNLFCWKSLHGCLEQSLWRYLTWKHEIRVLEGKKSRLRSMCRREVGEDNADIMIRLPMKAYGGVQDLRAYLTKSVRDES